MVLLWQYHLTDDQECSYEALQLDASTPLCLVPHPSKYGTEDMHPRSTGANLRPRLTPFRFVALSWTFRRRAYLRILRCSLRPAALLYFVRPSYLSMQLAAILPRAPRGPAPRSRVLSERPIWRSPRLILPREIPGEGGAETGGL